MISLTSKTDRAMKKIMKFVAALAVVLTASCNKDIVTPEVKEEAKTVKVTMNATVINPATRLLLDDNVFKWEIGDKVMMRWANNTYDNTTDGESLTASGNGSSVTFEGEFSKLPKKSGDDTKIENLYVYSAKDAEYINESSVILCKSVPQQQTGRLEDLENYVIYESYLSYKDMTTTKDDDGNYTSVSFDASLHPIFSLVKMTVPAELNLTSVTLTTGNNANIAGLVAVNPSKRTSSTAIGGGNAQLVNRSTNTSTWTATVNKEMYNSVVVSQDGEILSGDIYFTIVPDEYDKSLNAYCCSATALKFIFTSNVGSFEYTNNLNDKICMGELKNLGSVPANLMLPKVNGGTLSLIDATTLAVGVKDYNGNCEYYYEIGTSKENCVKPTTKSTKFDPESGFTPALGTNYFDKYYIKVLIHSLDNNYKDVVLEASLRNWAFKDGCEAGKLLAQAAKGEILTTLGEEQSTSDGLILVRRLIKDGDPTLLSFEQTAARIALLSARLPLYMPIENDSHATLWFCIDKKTCIGTGKRTFNLYYNDRTGRVDEINGYNVRTSINGAEETSSGRKAIVWTLGQLNSGDKVAPVGDGQHVLYSMAILEVL